MLQSCRTTMIQKTIVRINGAKTMRQTHTEREGGRGERERDIDR